MNIDLKKAKNLSASFPEDIPECRNLKTTLDYAKCYSKLGFTVIPLKPRDKVPIVEWKQYQDPNNKPTEEDWERWFKGTDNNIGIVCGRASGNLVALDFDDPLLFTSFQNKLESQAPELFEKIKNTLQNATKDGFHLLLRIDMDPDNFAQLFPSLRDIKPHFDIRAEGGYIVAPPSIHPEPDSNGNPVRYHFIPNDEVLLRKRPVTITYDEWQTIMKVLDIPPEKYPGVSRLSQLSSQEAQTPAKPKEKPVAKQQFNGDSNCRNLTDTIIDKIVNDLLPYYVKGHRNAIIMSMLGAFLKANICRDTAWKFVDKIADLTNDEEKRPRLYDVDYHYKIRAINPGVQNLKGLSGLREEIESVLTERNVSPDIVTQEASKVVAEIYSLLGLRKAPGVAWLKGIVNGEITEWIAQGKTGIYVYKTKGDSVEYILVTPLRIKKVVELKVIGLDIKNLYKVVLVDGVELWGTISEIMDSLKAQYPINPTYAYALQRLIEFMAEDTEEVFYSPGVWGVDGKVTFVNEPGYLPPWKRYVRWEINKEDPGEEAIRDALLKIKRFVESYRDPSKPSTVLSYAIIAPFATYIKQTLNIFPHMIIHGLEGTGKSVLIDFVKLLLGVTWSEELPNSDFQVNRVLTTATLPAIIDEIGAIVEGYRKDMSNSIKVVEALHRSATQDVMRVVGGHEYGGYYLAIRSVIATTNSDITFLPWQIDKFIIVEISIDEAIDINKAKGVTPRTMDTVAKKNIQYIGYMLLKGFEGKLEEIEWLKTLPRDELKERLIDIGYSLWAELYRRYGLEPFPAPNKGETEVAKVTLKDQYMDIFLSYVLKAVKNGEAEMPVKGEPVIERFLISQVDIEEDPWVLKSLNEYHAIRVIDNANGGDDMIIMKPTFLTGFMKWAEDKYDVQYIGWRKLSQLLGLKLTAKRIGGETVKNIFVMKLD